jgi:hypothetical protein
MGREYRHPPGHIERPRFQHEEAFNEALTTEGSPEEAAKLLWEAARGKEPWAIQELCRRFGLCCNFQAAARER